MWEPDNMKSTWPEVYEVPAELTEKQLDLRPGPMGNRSPFSPLLSKLYLPDLGRGRSRFLPGASLQHMLVH